MIDRTWPWLAAVMLLVAPLARADELPPDVRQVQECMSASLPGTQSTQTVALAAHAKDGAVNAVRATLWWRRAANGHSKARVLVHEPEDLRGTGVLLIERDDGSDTFLYLPEVKRVRRITGRHVSGSLFGTDLTYEHLERLQGIARDASLVRQPDAMLDGRKVYVLESVPAPRPAASADPADPAGPAAPGGATGPSSPDAATKEVSEIARVVTYVDPSTCVPLKTELYGQAGALRWVMTADPARVTKEGEGHVPRAVKLEDVKRGSFTEITIERIDSVTPVPERQFSETALVQDGK